MVITLQRPPQRKPGGGTDMGIQLPIEVLDQFFGADINDILKRSVKAANQAGFTPLAGDLFCVPKFLKERPGVGHYFWRWSPARNRFVHIKTRRAMEALSAQFDFEDGRGGGGVLDMISSMSVDDLVELFRRGMCGLDIGSDLAKTAAAAIDKLSSEKPIPS